MSAINTQVWSIANTSDSKYEKCRNITEEIYKRINITFQIKKAAQSDVSDQSDQIDSNELSNETDLFACDKLSNISSSTEADGPTSEKYININNNEEQVKKTPVVYKRPRKRFRKRVKKRQSKPTRSESDGSSDEAVPLSRMVDVDTKSETDVMGVPNILIVTKDLKPKIQQSDNQKKSKKDVILKTDVKKDLNTDLTSDVRVVLERSSLPTKDKTDCKPDIPETTEKEPAAVTELPKTKDKLELKNCNMCSLSFRGERGLRRHMTMSHIVSDMKTITDQREVKPT